MFAQYDVVHTRLGKHLDWRLADLLCRLWVDWWESCLRHFQSSVPIRLLRLLVFVRSN